MPLREIPKGDRMVRLVCKALLERPLQREEFLARMSRVLAADRRGRRTPSYWLKMADVDPAVELAASKGWVVVSDGNLRLTTGGENVARHSRVGRRRTVRYIAR